VVSQVSCSLKTHLIALRYDEAIQVLYSSNTFEFESLETFLAFSCAVIPRSFDTVRSLQLNFRFGLSAHFMESHPGNDMPRWERTWRVIATMKCLEEIKMRIIWARGQHTGEEIPPEKEVRFLEPLKLVRGLRIFEVTLPRLKETITNEMEDIPFQIIR
jgi:hypothetical protein